ncbi:MAG: hypothetical protein ABJA83_15465, partial [Burkholderiaceae bacterium]
MLLQLSVELGCLFLAGIVAVFFLERISFSTSRALAPQLAFAVLIVALNIGFGIYRRIEKLSSGAYLIRLFLSFSIGTLLAYWIAEALPGGEVFKANLGVIVLLGVGGLLLVRHGIVLPLLRTLHPHRVLVL